MQKFYRLSVASLIVSLVLLTAPPARAGHVIAAAGAAGLVTLPVALTNTGDVFQVVPLGTWTLIGTVPGAFGFFVNDVTETFLLSVQGTTIFRSLVSGFPPSIGSAQLFATTCTGAPIRSFVINSEFPPVVTTVHEDGTICFGGDLIPGPGEPVAVEETTWGAVKDTYKFKD